MSYYPPEYVAEEQDFSESDCPSDAHLMQHVTSGFTELYRRKHQPPSHSQNLAGTYYHTHMPGYIRGPPTQLCKRPSALCLPVTCQPDPAASNRSRKASTEIQHYRGQEASYAINDYVMRRTAVKRTTDTSRPVDSEGDVNSKLVNLENLLTKFDGNENEEEDENDTERVEITGLKDISKILKPKVPATVKAKQEKVLKLRAVKTSLTETIPMTEKVNKLEVKEAPPEPLEVLLKKMQKDNKKLEEKGDQRRPSCNAFRPKPEVSGRHHADQKHPLDDTSALELHKSKSYIVSLIDKALSKELGTVPGDKCTRTEFVNMDPMKAVTMVNRHSSATAQRKVQGEAGEGSCSKDGQCVCRNEEPMYLKQLKQLRWSHLRHIQREAKRLADLEKFLDSFSEADNLS